MTALAPVSARLPTLLGLPVIAGIALVLAVACVVSPVLGVALTVIVLGVPLAVVRPEIVVFGFVASTWFELPLLDRFPPAIKLAGATLILCAVLALVARPLLGRRERPAWLHHPLQLGALALLGMWAAASLGWAPDTVQAKFMLGRLVPNLLVLLAVGVLITSLRQLRTLGWTIFVSAIGAALYGFMFKSTTTIAGERSVGSFGDPNEYAAALVAAIAIGYCLMDGARAWTSKLAIAGGIGLLFLAVLQSQSRGGLVGFIAMAFVLMVTARGVERLRLVGVGLLLASVTIGFLGTPQGALLTERLSSTDSSGRADLWEIAIDMSVAHPVTGVGIGQYPLQARNFITADTQRTDLVIEHPETTHNFYLEVLSELGFTGLAVLAVLLGATMLVARRGIASARRYGEARDVGIGRGMLAALVGMLACNVFLSGQYQELLWVLMGALGAYEVATRRRLAKRTPAVAVPPSTARQLQMAEDAAA